MTDETDTKTPEMVEKLKTFWLMQEVLKRNWEPFNQADLIFEADQDSLFNPSLSSQPESLHWHIPREIRYDDANYQAQGVEPPIEDVEFEGSFFKGLITLMEFYAPFMVIVASLCAILFWGR